MEGSEGLDLGFERLTSKKMNPGDNSGEIRGLRLSEWKDIPVELLMRVLSLLDDQTVIVASGVCHGWRDGISWSLAHFSLFWCRRNMNSLALSLVPKFTKLQVLILRQDVSQLLDGAVEEIAAYCHELQELDLSNSILLTDRSLYALARGCPDLVRLNISRCMDFSDSAVEYLTGFCRKLEFLILSRCVEAATNRGLKAIGRNCNKLQSLNLEGCYSVGDEGVKSLAYGCPDLRALELSGCVRITDESIEALDNNCPYMRSLGLHCCQKITNKAMYSLAQRRAKSRQEVLAMLKMMTTRTST